MFGCVFNLLFEAPRFRATSSPFFSSLECEHAQFVCFLVLCYSFLDWPSSRVHFAWADTFQFGIHCACHLHNAINQVLIFNCPNVCGKIAAECSRHIPKWLWVLHTSVSLWQFRWIFVTLCVGQYNVRVRNPSSSISIQLLCIGNFAKTAHNFSLLQGGTAIWQRHFAMLNKIARAHVCFFIWPNQFFSCVFTCSLFMALT